MAKTFKQGYYTPINPEKYKGDIKNICFRSSWELEFCKFCDRNTKILEWGSETIVIPYMSPVDNRVHKYYPDFYITYINKAGEIVKELIEIKPESQINPPRKNIKNPKQRVYEQVTYAVNVAKWNHANIWCQKNGVKFRLLTEKQLFK